MSGPDTRQDAEAFVSRCLHPYADEHDVPAIADELHGLARSWDVGSLLTFDFWQVVKRHARDGDALPELTAATATAEIAWVAREARALRGSDDEQRRARFMARKSALLAYIESTTGGAS